MVLHKQLRVLRKGTPCVVVDTSDRGTHACAYAGESDKILARLTSGNRFRNSFVREVRLIDEDDASYVDYDMHCKSFMEIRVKCKEVI